MSRSEIELFVDTLQKAHDLASFESKKAAERLFDITPLIVRAIRNGLSEADQIRLDQIIAECSDRDIQDKNLRHKVETTSTKIIDFLESKATFLTPRDFLFNLRWRASQLDGFYKPRRDDIKTRGKMLARRFFGDNSPYILEIERLDFERRDEKGDYDHGNLFYERDRLKLLVDTMLEELEIESRKTGFEGASSFRDYTRDMQNAPFSIEEQKLVASVFEEIKILHGVNDEIKKELDYIAAASARVGKKDWLLMVMGWGFDKAITASLDTQTLSMIFSLIHDKLHSIFITLKLLASYFGSLN
jgi:hypothetical protein